MQVNIDTYLKEIMKSVSTQPSLKTLHQLHSVQNEILEKKQELKKHLQIKKQLKDIIHDYEIQEYMQLSKVHQTEMKLLKLLKHMHKISSYLQEWGKLIETYYSQACTNEKKQLLSSLVLQLQICQKMTIIEDFERDAVQLLNTSNCSNQIQKIKSQLYEHIKKKVEEIDEIFKQKMKGIMIIKGLLFSLGLPLRKGKNHKINLTTKLRKIMLHYLHHQCCSHSLHKYLSEEDNKFQPDINGFSSDFFHEYWHSTIKAIRYLFLTNSQTHRLQSPEWMFEYLQQTFSCNYRYFIEHVFEGLQTQKTLMNSHRYFLTYNEQYFFLSQVLSRFQCDIQLLKQQPFLVFNFLNQLQQFQQKLTVTFNYNFNLMEPLLLQFEIKRKYPILHLCFKHQNQWIQQKIFQDFYNINYNRINLKNLQAYNITQNFTILFQILWSKFRIINNIQLIQAVYYHYQQKILQLISHIKTSFDRIYKYSGQNKLEIIKAFKAIQKQFRNNFDKIIQKRPDFHIKIKKEYYQYLKRYFEQYALQNISIYHHNIIQQLNKDEYLLINKKSNNINNNNNKQQSYLKYIIIFQKWKQNLYQLNKIYKYNDIKLKKIFFNYLQSTKFTQQGFQFFLSIFKSFLIILFEQQGFKILQMLLLMDKSIFKNYITTHITLLSFLDKIDLDAIYKLTIL